MLALVFLPSASAGSNWGDKTVREGCCPLRGTQSGLQVPNKDYPLPAGTAGLMRVVSEKHTSDPGLFQIGYGRTQSIQLSDCGDMPTLHHFWEYHVAAPGGTYHCRWLDDPLAKGSAYKYTIFRRNCDTCGLVTWGAYLNGTLKLSARVSYDTATLISAGGELSNNVPGSVADGAMHGCYACAGSQVWQRSEVAAPAASQWITVQNALHTNTDGQWQIGSLPGAFGVDHYYP